MRPFEIRGRRAMEAAVQNPPPLAPNHAWQPCIQFLCRPPTWSTLKENLNEGEGRKRETGDNPPSASVFATWLRTGIHNEIALFFFEVRHE